MIVLLSAFGFGYASPAQQLQPPVKQWEKTFGGSGSEVVRGSAQATDGGYVVAGWSPSNISGEKSENSRGLDDYWIVKVDANGTKQWDRTFGGNRSDILQTMQRTADGGYILGGSSSSDASGDKTQPNKGSSYLADYWIVKLDAAGNKQWDRTFGGTATDNLYTVQQTSDGGYVLGGASMSPPSGDKTQPNLGSTDYWVVKTDANGIKQWDRTFGGAGSDFLTALRQLPDGSYVLGGWSASGPSGDKTDPSRGGSDYWVLKLDAAGNRLWDRTFGGNGDEYLGDLQLTADGGYCLGGYSASEATGDKTEPSRGGNDYWVLKLDANGNQLWDRTFGGSGSEILTKLYQLQDGGFILGGNSTSGLSGDKSQPSQGNYDYWVVRLDPAGNKQWDLAFGGNKVDGLSGLQLTTDHGFLLAGNSESDVSSDKTQPSRGSDDFWVVKLSPERITTAVRPSALAADLQVYPNPAHAVLQLQLPAVAPGTALRLKLVDATGRLVWQQQRVTGADATTTVETGTPPPGLYLLRVHGPSGYQATQRVLLE